LEAAPLTAIRGDTAETIGLKRQAAHETSARKAATMYQGFFIARGLARSRPGSILSAAPPAGSANRDRNGNARSGSRLDAPENARPAATLTAVLRSLMINAPPHRKQNSRPTALSVSHFLQIIAVLLYLYPMSPAIFSPLYYKFCGKTGQGGTGYSVIMR
jgi:hypothetical protein